MDARTRQQASIAPQAMISLGKPVILFRIFKECNFYTSNATELATELAAELATELATELAFSSSVVHRLCFH